ncbi:hypothetical protein TH25_20905 [Thalassospira profundimaris]|uniref:Metal-binding protein n=1 Tax=Thalassospira profundimaris TaxID=502049 RepID=A0A367WRS0_9PROT|nr:DUF1636 domain-containing protein [Thalassospira profundimaris]RCK43899.1 hypothetical protein TH25_20905 [Thalassospira profundimaris]
MPATTRLHVCITCRTANGTANNNQKDERDGKILHDALVTNRESRPDIEIIPVECLSNCKSGCSLALSAPGKWGYVYGNLNPDQHQDDILKLASAYAQSGDGIVPWRERPEGVRRNVIARIPPVGA